MTLEVATSEAVDLKEVLDGHAKLASHEGMGLTSKQKVKVDIYQAPEGRGIVFFLKPADGHSDGHANGQSDDIDRRMRFVFNQVPPSSDKIIPQHNFILE